MLARRGDRRLLTDIVARAHEDRLVTTAFLILRPRQGLTPRLDEAGGARATASPSASSGGSAIPTEAAAPSEPRPASTPTMVALAATRRAAQVEQDSARRAETAPEPVDPLLSRSGVHQALDLIDLLSSFDVARTFVSPVARSRQSLTPWAPMSRDSVTLVESLDLAVFGPDAQIDGEAHLGCVHTFTARHLHEHASPTVLSVAGTARNTIIEEIRAYASTPITDGKVPCLGHSQVLIAHVEHAGDSLMVTALETHGVTTRNPAARAHKASKKH